MFIDKKPEELVALFEPDLLDTNRGFNYYVDWGNIDGYKKYSIEFHAMDALIGCADTQFHSTFNELLKKVPSSVATFPYLFGLSKVERNHIWSGASQLKIIGTELDSEDFQEYGFSNSMLKNGLSDDQISEYYEFFKQMGLKELFQNLLEKSVLDYIIGVLVGLDSNGRKNRGGKAFELACEPMLNEISNNHNVKILSQKKFSVLRDYGFSISTDIENRKFDFILFDVTSQKCMNVEVNFYNGGGSKPEEIIDSYINRQADLTNNSIKFALITDGNCWRGTTNQLAKGFRHLHYLMNFKLAKRGMLDEIVSKVFNK